MFRDFQKKLKKKYIQRFLSGLCYLQCKTGLTVFWLNYFVLNQNDLKHMLDTKKKMQVVGTIWICKDKKTLKGFFVAALNSGLNTL